MAVRFLAILLFLVELAGVPCGAVAPSGELFLKGVADYVYSSRKIDFQTDVKYNGEAYTQKGFFIANKEHCYIKLDSGAELEYTADKVIMYNPDTEEYIIQPNKGGAMDLTNPFSLLAVTAETMSISEPQAVKGAQAAGLYSVSITPKLKKKGAFKEAKVFVAGWKSNRLSLHSIVITTKQDNVYDTKILKVSSLDAAFLGRCKVTVEQHPNAKVTDLTD